MPGILASIGPVAAIGASFLGFQDLGRKFLRGAAVLVKVQRALKIDPTAIVVIDGWSYADLFFYLEESELDTSMPDVLSQIQPDHTRTYIGQPLFEVVSLKGKK
jgi:hypothetical protein